ncbi:WD40 repeat domain-containing serine/threonine protein kinase [Nocardiopsis trehalosi]|uniref:WD40 repeat domain-containing serine/threonine protein kinase n=1 Tax=Nocardiopsis trehalosi TaxID=109329 RepID=UPI0008358D72|nr:serine/threonine-protein kinase [Nocardiopsis trehalosi]
MDPLEPSDPAHIGGYRLIHRLGEGGMGRVYLAATPSGRRVAVKVIRPALVREAGFRARFAREVDAARRVGGFHTAPVVAADPEGDPAWVATAYIPGPTLDTRVRDNGPIAPPALHALAAGLAEGLKAVHACGLVHRDLKPGNIILSGDGPRIIDFGIARPLDSEGLTTHEAVFGTLPYMSPEQTENSHVGPASDMFSLGTVLAYAATGTNPFNGASMAATIRRLIGPPPDPGDVDPETRALITACWDHDPERRPTPDAVLTRFGALAARTGPPPATDRPAAEGGGPEVTTFPPAATYVDSAADRSSSKGGASDATTFPPAPTYVDPAADRPPAKGGGSTAAPPPPAPPAPPFAAPARPPRAAAGRPGGSTPDRVRRKGVWLVVGAVVAFTTVPTAGAWLVAEGPGGEPSDTVSVPPPEPLLTLTGHEDTVNSVAFSPDGTALATSDTAFSVRVWDTGTWEESATLIEEDSPVSVGTPSVAFDPDGTLLATGHESVRLWGVGTWEEVATILEDDWITSVAFSSDGTTLATSDPVGNVRFWNTSTGSETAAVEGPPDYVTSMAFSPDGTTLASATAVDQAGVFEDSDGGAVRLWDSRNGAEIAVLTSHDSSFESVAFSPDGGLLAACDGDVRLWDTGTREEVTTLTAAEATASLAFSPDGSTIATGHEDGTVRLRDTETWEETAVYPAVADHGRVTSVAFSTDGTVAAAGHSDGTILLWPVG